MHATAFLRIFINMARVFSFGVDFKEEIWLYYLLKWLWCNVNHAFLKSDCLCKNKTIYKNNSNLTGMALF